MSNHFEANQAAKDLSEGVREHKDASMQSAFNEIRDMQSHGNVQFKNDLAAMNKQLQKDNVLGDLTIVGFDSKNNEVLAKNKAGRDVLIDHSGHRSDFAEDLAHKRADAIKVIGKNVNEGVKELREFNHMESDFSAQLSGNEKLIYTDIASDAFQDRTQHVRLVDTGENMRHGANSTR